MQDVSQRFDGMDSLGYCQAMSGFQTSGFDVLSMTYLNPRFARLNGDITGFTSVDLNSSYLQSKYIADC